MFTQAFLDRNYLKYLMADTPIFSLNLEKNNAILKALVKSLLDEHWTQLQIAEKLGLHKNTLSRYVKIWGIKSKMQGKKTHDIPEARPSPQAGSVITSQAIPSRLDDDDETIDLPESFKKAAKYCKKLKHLGVETNFRDMLTFVSEEKIEQKPVVYKRPSFFTATQFEIIDSIQIMNTIVEGDRQTGKTISIYGGIGEYLITHESQCHFIASNRDNAIKLFRKVANHALMRYLEANYSVHPTSSFAAFYNTKGTTSTFEVHSTTVGDVKGCTGMLWIDELDEVLRRTPEVIAAAVALTRSDPNLHLIFSMNKGTGTYRLLLETLKKHEMKGKLAFIELTKDKSFLADINPEDSNEELIADIMNATMGEDYVASQLRNEETGEGDVFEYGSLEDAFGTYEAYMNVNPTYPGYHYLAIDPSGTGHPFGIFVGSYDPLKDEVCEIESYEWKLGDGKNMDTLTPSRLNDSLVTICKKHNIKKAVVEPNSGGHQIAINLRAHNIQCFTLGWGGPEKANSRANYVRLARHFLDERKIYLKNPRLKMQLSTYNLSSKTEEGKGDVADSFLLFLWLAVGGLKYLKKLYNKNELKVKAV